VRDAVDAAALLTNGAKADGEVVWSWRPDAGIKLAGDVPRTRVATKPGSPGRARRKPLKPFACGNAGWSGVSVVT